MPVKHRGNRKQRARRVGDNHSSMLVIVRKQAWRLPIFNTVPAGSPEPIDEYLEGEIDLNEELIRRPLSTFGVRVTGESMIDDGIHPGDLLIVDRSLVPTSQDIVVVLIDNELTVKRLSWVGNTLWLVPSNSMFLPSEVKQGQDCQVRGVVLHAIHTFRHAA